MRKLLMQFLSALFVLAFTTISLAQETATATWSLQTDGSVQNSGKIIGTDQFITSNLVYGSYASPGSNFYTQRIKMPTWPTNQLTQLDSVYIQYKAAPLQNYNLVIDSVVFDMGAVSTKDMRANLYYSTDSTFNTKTKVDYKTSVGAISGKPAGTFLAEGSLDTLSFKPNVTVNQGQSFYFRVYPWVDSSSSVSGKYVAMQNVVIYATAKAIPVSAFAIWPLSSQTESATVSGLINASDITFGGDLYHYGYNANGDRWMTHSGAWPKDTVPDFSRYAQVSVAPKTGGTFFPSSLSFKMIEEYSKNLRVAMYYSNDTSFTNKKFIADTAVPQTSTYFSYNIQDTVATGDTMYVRFYPYDVTGDPAYKLVDIDSLKISGNTTGLAILLPTVATTSASYISTKFLTIGGNITADGGGKVTVRGVCWDTAANPTIADSIMPAGSDVGSFSARITGLTPGKTYHFRAYGTNVAGTAYGSDLAVATLSNIVVPTVSTTSVSKILNTSAQSGGNVTDWGGDTVTVKGVCWNSTGNPTISDTNTQDGNDIGSYISALRPLTPNSTYYVRAYATNSAGTGYGTIDTFMTQQTSPTVYKVVAKDGSGDYTSVQDAFNAVPDNYTGTYVIYVKNGTYKEKLMLAQTKVNVVLEGESRDSTILTYDDYAGKNNLGTSGSYSVDIEGSDFTAMNLTIQNTYPNDGSVANQQAVALETNGDRQSYFNCNILGYQDTYYSRGAHGTDRIYMNHCYIDGSVDFIFGRDIVVFDSCEIHENRNGGTLTAASTDADSKFGYVFLNCKISTDSIGFDGKAITTFDLGRPWQAAPRSVYIDCYEPANLDPAGWLTWNVAPALYAEYNCTGPGYQPASRIASISTQLTSTESADYTIPNIFAKTSNPSFAYSWMPVKPVVTGIKSENQFNQIPKSYQLYQNYPNPFNPSTTIKFAIPQDNHVTLEIYNILGQRVSTLINRDMKAGVHQYNFNAAYLSSGVYFYRITSGNFSATKKLLLLK